MNDNGNGRLESFDFAKGLLIIMVVWGHFCSHSSGYDYEKNVLTSIIRLFQMPLFILISGYFQKRVFTNSEFLKRINKTINHIGIPLLCWSIMATLVLYILSLLGVCDSKFSAGIIGIIKAIYSSFRFYWFLPCLMLCIAFNAMLCLLASKLNIKIWLLHLLSVVLLLIMSFYMFHFQFMWPFFIIGIYLNLYSRNSFVASMLRGTANKKVERVMVLLMGGGYFMQSILANSIHIL